MEEALNNSSIIEEHRILMGVVFQSIWSIDNGLKEDFGGHVTGFKINPVIPFYKENFIL